MKTGKKYGFKYNFYKYRRIFSAKKARLYKKYDTSYNTSFDRSKLSSNAGFYTVFNAVKSHMTSHPIYHYSGVVAGSFILGLLIGKLATPVSQSQALATISADTNTVSTSVIESVSTPEKINISELGASANTAQSAIESTTPTATKPVVIDYTNKLSIARLGINATAIYSYPDTNMKLPVPATGVARYGALIFGHNNSTMGAIRYLSVGDVITFEGRTYRVSYTSDFGLKNEKWLYDTRQNGVYYAIDNLRDLSSKIALMTCSGPNDSMRRIVFADLV